MSKQDAPPPADEDAPPGRATQEILETLGIPLIPTLEDRHTLDVPHSSGVSRGFAETEAITAAKDLAYPESDTLAIPEASLPDAARPLNLPRTSDFTGEHIGRFQVLDELGSGGMGRVMRARDPELRRTVAVKVVREPEQVSKGSLSRFVAEAQITSQLEHPNIVPVHELGVTGAGELFFVMKRVSGRSLEEVIKALASNDPETVDEWPLYKLLGALVQVCQAVAYAHERGVLHRDLKPANVMTGDFGEVLVMDWGVARLMGDTTEKLDKKQPLERVTLVRTMDGAAVGTPGFMSPEQARGRVHELDARSDVWSLGAILYQILTLQSPFPRIPVLQLMLKAATEAPVPPSDRAPERSIHPEIEQICLRAMAIEPAERFASALDLADAIEEFMVGSERRRREQRRRRIVQTATIAVLLVAAVSASIFFNQWRRAERAMAEAEVRGILAESRRQEQLGRSDPALALVRAAAHLEADLVDGPGEALIELERLAGGGQRVRTLAGHEGGVTDLAVSLDGELAATASRDGTTRIWEVETGDTLAVLSGHGERVSHVTFSPTDDVIATGAQDGMVRLWTPRTGTPRGEPLHAGAPIRGLEFAPSGARLAAATSGGRVLIWSLGEEEPRSVVGHQGTVHDIAFAPDGLSILSGGADGNALIIDAETGDTLHTLQGHGSVESVAWAPEGDRLATGTKDGKVVLWTTSDPTPVRVLTEHEGAIEAMEFSRDGTWLATASADRTAAVWSAEDGALRARYRGHTDPVTQLALTPDAGRLATASVDGNVRVWDVASGSLQHLLQGHRGLVTSVRWLPGGTQLVSGSSDRTAVLWDSAPPDLSRALTASGSESRARVCRETLAVVTPATVSADISVFASPDDCRDVALSTGGLAAAQDVARFESRAGLVAASHSQAPPPRNVQGVEHRVCVMTEGPGGIRIEGMARVGDSEMRPTFQPRRAFEPQRDGSTECSDGGNTSRWREVRIAPRNRNVEFVYSGTDVGMEDSRGRLQRLKLPERWADPASEPSCLAITLVVGGDGRVASEPRIDPLYEKAGSGCR